MGNEQFLKDYLKTTYCDYELSKDKIDQFYHNYGKYFPVNKDTCLLDIGPGLGEMLELWKRLGYKNYVAVDISEEVIEHCRQRGLGEVKLIPNLYDFLKDKKETFDFITMIEVIEHLKKNEILKVCVSIRDCLKPNGRVIIETPNMGAIFGSLLRYHDFTHETGFTIQSLFHLMKTAGFKQIEVKGFECIIKKDLRSKVRKFSRDFLLYPAVRIIRKMNDSDLSKVFMPYIYATGIK